MVTLIWKIKVVCLVKHHNKRIIELEEKIKLLENQKSRAEHLAERAFKKAILFDMMIDLAEKEFNISMRKNSKPKKSICLQ